MYSGRDNVANPRGVLGLTGSLLLARRLSFVQHLILMGLMLAMAVAGLVVLVSLLTSYPPPPPSIVPAMQEAGRSIQRQPREDGAAEAQRGRGELNGTQGVVVIVAAVLLSAVIITLWLGGRLCHQLGALVSASSGAGWTEPGGTRFTVPEFEQIKGAFSTMAGERWQDEQRLDFLVQELQHRTNNLLAVVSSIARHTLVGGRPVAEARELFLGRLHALANASATLANSNWKGADMAKVVANEMTPFAGRFIASGPGVLLSAPLAQSASLLIHELATNARRYGALSTEGGRVMISWRLAAGAGSRCLELEWVERGGPPAAPPERRGFGCTLLQTTLAESKPPVLSFDQEGFTYRTALPLDESLPEAA